MLVDRANMLTVSVPEMTVLVGGLRAVNANSPFRHIENHGSKNGGALEALQEDWRTKRVSMNELWRYAAPCRAVNVTRPYRESLA